ncbi:hypothetical protein HQ576_02815, partial [bacterium]|nr:hypothetical protein [bacterium]
MKFNCHCHIFGLDCVPEEFRQRFFLDPRNVLHRLMHWLVRRLVPSGAGLRDWLEFLDLSIEQIARRLVAEMDAAGIDVATPLMMDMAYCSGFGGAAKSFEEQMAETAAAVQAINAECGRARLLPFVAADPRRDGVVPLVVQALTSGAFHGVKIYPVMGFLPADERLTPLYDHCVAHAVPVTTHCQNGGIPGLRRYYHLADPAGWERVLEQDRFRTLTLNLGHNDCTHTRWQ